MEQYEGKISVVISEYAARFESEVMGAIAEKWGFEKQELIDRLKKLSAYEDTNLEPAEVVKAKKENRILPEEFACLTLSDGKTLAAWYPKGKNVAVQRHENYELSERKELTEDD